MIMNRDTAYDLTVNSVMESWFDSVELSCKQGRTSSIIRDIHVKEDILLKVIREFKNRDFNIEIIDGDNTQDVFISWE